MAITNPKEVLGVEKVNRETGLTSKRKTVIKPGLFVYTGLPTQTTYPGQVPSAYTRILGDDGYHPEFGQERVQEMLAQEQSAFGQFGNMLNQAIVGEIIGGTIEGLGYLLDIPQYSEIAAGTEQEWGNFISDFGKSIKTWTEDVTPIYRDPNAAKFAPGDWSWWMKNFKSVASTLSLMIPAAGTVKGISMLGKALGIAKNIGVTAKWALTGISQAMISRHMENLMEGVQLFDERLKENLALGMSREEATKNASIATANSYRLNWVMIMQDIPQYLLFGSFGKTGKAATEKMFGAAKKMGLNLGPLYARKGASIAFDMVGEGGEEAYQYIVQQESAYLSKRAVNQAVKSSFEDRLSSYIRDGEMWTNAWFGAIGAGVMQVGRAGYEKIATSKQTQKKLDFIGTLGAMAKYAQNQVRMAHAAGDPDMIETSIASYEKSLFEKAAHTNNLHNVRTFIEQVAQGDPADLENHKISPEDVEFIKENKDSLLDDLTIFEEYFKKATDKNSRYPQAIAASRLFLDKYNKILKGFKTKASKLKGQQLMFLEKSPEGKRLFENEYIAKMLIGTDDKGENGLITRLTKQRSKTTEGSDEYKYLTSRIIAGETQLKKIRAEQIEDNTSRSKEQKIIDDAYKVDASKWAEYISVNVKIKNTENAILAELSNLELFESGIDLADPDAINKYADSKSKQEPERSEFEFEVDDVVDYVQETGTFRGVVVGHNKEEDAPRYIIQQIDEHGKEIGEPIVVDADSLTKVIDIDDGNPPEDVDENNLTPEEKKKYSLVGGLVNSQQTIQYVLFDTKIGAYTIENKAFDKWASTASNEDIAKAKVVFKIPKYDKTSHTAGFYERMREIHGDEVVDKLIAGKKLTNDEAHSLLQAKSDLFDSFVDGFKIDVEVNGIAGAMNMHASNWSNIQIPPSVKRSGELTINLYRTNKYNEARVIRRNILYNLLRGIKVKSKGITRTKGFPNTRPKTQVDRNRNVAVALGLKLNQAGKIKLSVGTRANEVISAPNVVVATPILAHPGSVYASDNRTVTGEEGLIKLNKQKIHQEHAEILFDALMLRYQQGLGYQTKFPDDRVSGLTIGEVIDMLAYNGRKNTSPDHPSNSLVENPMSQQMVRSQLYVIHEGNTPILHFGHQDYGGGTLEINKGINLKKARLEFVSWARSEKNYPVYLTHLTTNKRVGLGIELNKRFARTFTIGTNAPKDITKKLIEHKGRGSYASFLIKSEMIMSDVELSEATNSPFHAPVVEFNADKLVKGNGTALDEYPSKVEETPEVEEVKKEDIPKAKINKVKEKKIVKGDRLQKLTDVDQIENLPIGSIIQNEIGLLDGEGNIEEYSRTVYGIVELGSEGQKVYSSKYKASPNQKIDGLPMTDPEVHKWLIYASLVVDTSNTVAQEEIDEVKQPEIKTDPIAEELIEETKEEVDPNALDPNLTKSIEDIMNDEEVTRIITSDIFEAYTPETLDKEIKYIADRLGIPKKEIKIVDKFIKLLKSGKLAHALYAQDSITVYRGAEIGTLYHEAFHRVSLGYLTPEERKAIYRSARVIYKMPKPTDKQIDEKLAEEFRLYIIRKKTNKPVGLHRKIADFFKGLYDYIVTFFAGEKRLNNYEIDSLFEDIYRGKFRYSTLLAENEQVLVNESYHRLVGDTEFTEIDTRAQYKEIVKGLVYYLITLNDTADLNNIPNLTWAPVIAKLVKIKSTFKRIAEDPKYPERARTSASRIASLYENILGKKNVDGVYEKFNSFIEAANIYLSSLGITAKYESDALDFEQRDASVRLYNKVAYEFSSKDTALASIKFMVAMLRENRSLRSYSGMPEFVNFNKAWSTIMYDLHDIEGIDEVIAILGAKKDNVKFYKDLLDKLTSLKPGTELLRTQFVRTVRKHKHDYINFLYTTDKSGVPIFQITNADTQRASRLETLMWSEAFSLSNLVEEGKDKKPVIKEKEFEVIKAGVKALKEDVEFEFNNNDKSLLKYDEYFDKTLALLNSISVSIDNMTLMYALDQQPGESKDDKLRHYISSNLTNLILSGEINKYYKGKSKHPIFRLHINEHQIKLLAEAQVKTHPELINDSVLGPGGNLFYTYASHSHVTHEIKKLKVDKSRVERRIKLIGNKHSQLLYQLLDDNIRPNISIKTLSALASRGGQDRIGRNYGEITKLEDYLIKFVASHNNLFNLPTMADKQVYYFLDGFNTFNDLLEVENDELVLSNKLLNIFEGYYKDEFERIEETTKLKQAYEDAETVETKQEILDRLVLNYHYDKLNSKGIPDWKGNAFKFQHFKGFNDKPPKTLKEARDVIRTILQKILKSEVEKVNQLLLILQDDKGKYSNSLLDKTILDRFVKHYKNEDLAIKSAVAIHTINSMMMSFETEKVLMGDAAFYKSDKRGQTEDDKFKRYGIMTGTGDQFAESVKGFGSELLEGTYNVTTIKTQKFSSSIYDVLVDKFVELGINRDLAAEQLKGYLDVDPTDGQTLITPEMYRQMMIRLGEWGNVESAYKLLTSTKVLNRADEIQALSIVMNPVKPVHFGLYINADNIEVPIYDKMSSAVLFDRVVKDTHLQEVLNRMRAVDKYESLERVDMLKFDTVVKVGGMKSMDLYKDGTERNELNDLSNVLVFKQDWVSLRRQTITDPHEAGNIRVGTQVIKVATSNIVKDADYGTFGTGVDIIKDIHSAISANSDLGLEEVKSELGYSDGKIHDAKFLSTLRLAAVKMGKSEDFRRALRIENGVPYLHIDSFPDRMWLQSRIVSIINKGTIDIKFPGNHLIQVSDYGHKGKGVQELKFLQLTKGASLIYKMEARVSIKLFKDVIPDYENLTHEERVSFIKGKPEIIGYRIPTQGQNSVVILKIVDLLPENSGDAIHLPLEFTVLTGADFDIDKLYIMRKNYKAVNGKLIKVQFDTDENAVPRYKDKVRELFWIHRDNPNVFTKDLLNKIDHIDIYKKHILTESANRKSIVGVFSDRLKTQHKMYKAETHAGRKDALYNNILNTITQIRSFREEFGDLDILLDSIFDEHYEHIRGNLVKFGLIPDSIDNFAKWSIHKQNTKKANQNRLIDAFTAILTNDRHFIGATTPLGVLTQEMQAMASKMRTLRGDDKALNSLESDTPSHMSKVKDKYIGGTAGIGPFALSNVHHAFTQQADISMNYDIGFGNRVEGGNLDLSQIYGKDDKLISDWLSALIDAHVDIAKDPYVMDLNVNPATYNALELMIRSGFGGMTAFKYISQPIMFDYADVLRTTKGSIKPDGTDIYTNAEARTIALNKVFTRWFKKAGKDVNKDKVDRYVNSDLFKDSFLQKGLTKVTNEQLRANEQLQILDYFKYYLVEPSEILTEFVQVSQIDTKRFGNNFIEIFTFNNRVKELISKGVINNIDKFFPMFEDVKNPLYISKMYENAINTALDIFATTSIQSTDMFTVAVNDLMLASKTGSTTNIKLARSVSNELFASLVGTFFTSPDYLNISLDQFQHLMYGNGSLFSQLIDIKNGTLKVPKDIVRKLKLNPFVDMLMTRFEDDVPSNDLHGFVVSPIQQVRDKWDLDDLVEGWEELIKDKNEVIQQFAKNAFVYSFYTSGFSNRLYSFFNYIPTNIIKGLTIKGKQVSYDSFIRELHISLQDISNVAMITKAKRDFYENNHYDPRFVPRQGVVTIAKSQIYSSQKAYADLVLAQEFKVEGPLKLLGFNTDRQPIFTPYVKVKDTLWGYVGFYQVTERDKIIFNPIYKRVTPKGLKHKGIVFKEHGLKPKETIIKENLIPVELTADREDAVISKKVDGFIHVPFESQVVIRENDELQDFANKRPEVEISNTPEFDKLPSRSNVPTMSYAGVGSRNTPQDVLDKMEELAIEFEKKGYVLNTGDAKGADTAFGAKVENKNVFIADDSTELTETIAKEIHPNPSALSGYPLKLMGRNTFQIFGADLKTPVDFAIVWTQEGETRADQRKYYRKGDPRNTGGTGQAIALAQLKGIPVINMANENWRQQLDAAIKGDIIEDTQLDIKFQLSDKPILGMQELVDYKALDKLYDKWQEVYPDIEINFRNEPKRTKEGKLILGEANLTAGTALIDAVNQKLDTVPHELAHFYIAWFRETPMVKEGIRRFGSEEELVQKIGEQAVKQKGEALGWWNKFTKWLLHLFSNEDILGLLTDAFLTRTDLTKADPILAAAIAKYPAGTITDWNNPYSWGIEGLHKTAYWKTRNGKRVKIYNRFTEKRANQIAKDIQAEGGIAKVHKSEKGRFTVEVGMRLDVSIVKAEGIRQQLEEDMRALSEIFNPKTVQLLEEHYAKSKDDSPLEYLLSKAKAAWASKIQVSKESRRIVEEKQAIDLLMRLENLEESPEEALLLLTRQSVKLVNKLFKTIEAFEKDPNKEITPLLLSNWATEVSTHNILDEIEAYITETFGFNSPVFNRKDAKITRDILRSAIHKKNYILNIYKTKGKQLTAEVLAPFYNRYRADAKLRIIKEYRKGINIPENITEDEYVQQELLKLKPTLDSQTILLMRNELSIAERDVGVATRWIDNTLDTADPVAAAVVKMLVLKDDKARIENIEKRKVFEEPLLELEKSQPTSTLQSPLEFYRFMLEFDKQGKPTGHLLSPNSSALMEEYQKVMEEKEELLREIMNFYITDKKAPGWISGRLKMSESFVKELIGLVEKGKDRNAISLLTKKWKSDNTNFKSAAFKEAYWKEVYRLREEKIIDNDDIINLQDNDRIYESKKLSFSEMADAGLLSDSAADAMTEWVMFNSWRFRVAKGKWINHAWASFMNDLNISINLSYDEQINILRNSENPKAKFYVFIIDIAKEADSRLPYHYRLGTRLPGIGKDPMERIKSNISFVGHLKESARREFTILADDLERQEISIKNEHGDIKQYMPIYYTARPTKKVDNEDVFDIDFQSFDLASIYYRYWAHTNSYITKKEVLPELEMAKHFVDTRETKDRSIFDLPIFIKSPFRSSDPEKEKDIPKTKKAKNIAGQLDDFFTMIVYGKKISFEGKFKIPFMHDSYIDTGKLADAVNRYTSINLLAGNFVQGFANIGIGQVMQTIEAIAGEHVDLKTYGKAQLYYWKQLPKMMGDVGLRTPQSVGNLLIEDFYILHEVPTDVDFSRTNRVSQIMRLSTVFFVQHIGEHSMQGQFLFAMLMKKKAFDKDGKELGNMLDMYKAVNGKLVIDSKVDLEKSNWTPENQLEFGYRLRGILSRMHGEYGAMGRIALQRFALGRMAYMFRKFVVPGIKRRYGKKRYIERLEDYVEGSYITMGHFSAQLGKDLLAFKFALMSEDWSNLSDHQKANIKRAISELVFLASAWILGSLIMRDDDDDEDDAWLMSFAAYQAYRLKAELLFFTPKLDEAFSILRSPAASVSVIENILKISDQMFTPMEKFERGPWKGQYKMTKYTINMMPLYRQYYKMRDVREQIPWFQQ